MLYRYACPTCEGDLQNSAPSAKKNPWYKLVMRQTMLCPHCGAEIEKRFAAFDAGLGAGIALMLTGGGFVSIWGVGKLIIPLVVVIFALRLLAGIIFTVYVQVKK